MHAQEHDDGDCTGARATTKRLRADIAYVHAVQRFNEVGMSWISVASRTIHRNGKIGTKLVQGNNKLAEVTREIRDAGVLCRRTKWDTLLPTLVAPLGEVEVLTRLGRLITVFSSVLFHSALLLGTGALHRILHSGGQKSREKGQSGKQ